MQSKKRNMIVLLLAALSIAACGGSSSRSNSEAKSLNQDLQAKAFQAARITQVRGLTFSVALVEGGAYQAVSGGGVRLDGQPYALVELQSPKSASYFGPDIAAAAQQVTGCKAEFAAGILAAVGVASSDLQVIGQKVTSSLRGWRANLIC